MTHLEAAVLYPVAEPFGAPGRPAIGDLGRAFVQARLRADALGLMRVVCDGDGDGYKAGPDGIILPGHTDAETFPGITRWLGAVTLYYRPRRRCHLIPTLPPDVPHAP